MQSIVGYACTIKSTRGADLKSVSTTTHFKVSFWVRFDVQENPAIQECILESDAQPRFKYSIHVAVASQSVTKQLYLLHVSNGFLVVSIKSETKQCLQWRWFGSNFALLHFQLTSDQHVFICLLLLRLLCDILQLVVVPPVKFFFLWVKCSDRDKSKTSSRWTKEGPNQRFSFLLDRKSVV